MGIPYDSPQGRDWAAAITAVMCGQAYLTSARIAEARGPVSRLRGERRFVPGCHPDARQGRQRHRQQARAGRICSAAAVNCWNDAYALGERVGFRNAQTTVIAPTGTIGFMMDCDTTGIEPDLALVKYKKLVGGGDHQDRQQHRAAGADQARLHARASGDDRHAHRCHRHH